MRVSDSAIKKGINIVGNYLFEFCEVNDVQESELKNHLSVVSCVSDNSILVINSGDQKDIKFGIRLGETKNEGSFDVFGEFLERKDNFPKTVKLIERNGGSTGNATVASGE